MARKKRDYKAEYAAAKRRAQSAGYKSEREYKAVRKALGTPRNAAPAPRRIIAAAAPETLNSAAANARSMASLRREAKAWSDRHSVRSTSRYTSRMTDEQVIRYHHAYVERIDGLSRRSYQREKRARIHDFLVPDFISDKEWKSTYE